MKRYYIILFLLASIVCNAQIQTLSGTPEDGSVTILPDGLISKKSGGVNDPSNVALGPNALKSILAPSGGPNSRYNTAIGQSALELNTTGQSNNALGYWALHDNTTGSNNIAIGSFALSTNVGKSGSVAIGNNAMGKANNQTLGGITYNTAIGFSALSGSQTEENNTGIHNTAIGSLSLFNNSSGSYNIANGSFALFKNETGNSNMAFGNNSLRNNKSGNYNIAIGSNTLNWNIGNSRSTAIGIGAMYNADSSSNGLETLNTAIGYLALYGSPTINLNTGKSNTAVGDQAMFINQSGSRNIAVGANALLNNSQGNNNTALGFEAGRSNANGSGNIYLGNKAGYYNLTSDKLYIENSDALHPLIWGDFLNDSVKVNGTFMVKDEKPETTARIQNSGGQYAKLSLNTEDNVTELNIFKGSNTAAGSIGGQTMANLSVIESTEKLLIGTKAEQNLYFTTFSNLGMTLQSTGNLKLEKNLDTQGFTEMGELSPKIKLKTIEDLTPIGLNQVSFTHGLNRAKILSVSVFVTSNNGLEDIPPNNQFVNQQYAFKNGNTNITLYNLGSDLQNKNPVKILITYKE
ncbi:hypothetical protein EGI22_10460 [Lacihabitans sp. LS3-19]|uniref:hypothetical protein n=1 Tax=Lacihabitans sp. LS3-19 TaxID=2487335 RepID=UPI0020CC94BD|nr:hypothetical protein [Lacihabitans sp. LS3-19]MCP9768336.1 hypothetical protein [Lacihabitans sp. LS3-19]